MHTFSPFMRFHPFPSEPKRDDTVEAEWHRHVASKNQKFINMSPGMMCAWASADDGDWYGHSPITVVVLVRV